MLTGERYVASTRLSYCAGVYGFCFALPILLALATHTASAQTCGGGVDCSTCCCPNGESGCDQGVTADPAPQCPTSSGCCSSPVVVDTTGRGFHLTSAEDGVIFDISGAGQPIKMAWTASDSGDAFLALDRNHNGQIDDGEELFGNYTQQSPCKDGTNHCFNGYRALAEFDRPENGGNGDGIIDERDDVFPHLLLWIDENHNGISEPNELHTLPELGVYSISLHYRDDQHFRDQYGNWFHYQAALNPDPSDGESRDGRMTYDVFFKAAGVDLDDYRFFSDSTYKSWAATSEPH